MRRACNYFVEFNSTRRTDSIDWSSVSLHLADKQRKSERRSRRWVEKENGDEAKVTERAVEVFYRGESRERGLREGGERVARGRPGGRDISFFRVSALPRPRILFLLPSSPRREAGLSLLTCHSAGRVPAALPRNPFVQLLE